MLLHVLLELIAHIGEIHKICLLILCIIWLSNHNHHFHPMFILSVHRHAVYLLFLICRDTDLTKKLDYSSEVAILGYSLIVSIMRSFQVRDEAARVMVAAPLLAFIATHILYLNNYKMDYGKTRSQFTFLL